MTPLQFTRSVRGLNRLRQVVQTLTQHGFGHVVARMDLTRFLPVRMLRRSGRAAPADEGASAIGRRLAMVCAELGPTFIKFGQLVSTRADIVPPEVLSELRKLQDEVPPFDTSTAMTIITEELGKPIDECFLRMDDAPFASGSIGQVYRARVHDGTDVVVKVRRPGIEQVIRLDIQLLTWLASSLESLVPELRAFQPSVLVLELEQMLTLELDYINEAAATARFAAGFSGDDGIRIPQVYWDYCGPRMLTLEELPGTNVATLLGEPEGATKINRRLVVRRLADCYLKQIFELGIFHADPHPGNILIDPPATIGLIDFGQVGTVSNEFITELVVLVFAAVNNEMELMVSSLADMDAVGPKTDRRQLQRALQMLRDKYYGLPIKRLDLTTLLTEFTDLARRHDVVIPREMTQLLKALGTAAGVMASIDPEYDLVGQLKPYLKRALRERFSPAYTVRAATLLGWDLVNIVRKAPRQIRETLRRLASGSLQLNVRHEKIDHLITEMDRSSNRLSFAIVIAAIIVGSSVVVSAATKLTIFEIPVQYFGIAGYLIAGVLGLGLSWAIFRGGRLH
ncbi:MAG: AarF/ABC1/UbiB kinase family protein [Planctomycetes bacterium]|nr:AarF/ABC1/UbiB kinase family protein [Planctomycetota bacterium]